MLLGVDTLMNMGRTALNVIGNCMAAAVVARWEGELKPAPTRTEFNKTDALRHPLRRRNCSHRCCHLRRPGQKKKHSRDPERYVLRHDLHDVNVALLCDHHPVWHQQGSGSPRRSTPARPRPAPPSSAAAAACKSSVARPMSSACPVPTGRPRTNNPAALCALPRIVDNTAE